MRICFYVAAHDRPEMLQASFKSIYAERHLYLLHIDRRATAAVAAVADALPGQQIPSQAVNWGGFSQVTAELRAMRVALSHQWDYFVNVSGTDLLVKPLAALEKLFDLGVSFIDRREIVSLAHPLKQRIRKRLRFANVETSSGNMRLLVPLRLLGTLPKYYGSQWHFLQRWFCEAAVREIDMRGIPFTLRHCAIPDEMFWQNILNDLPTIETRIVPENKRFAIFHGRPNPKWLTMDDAEAIASTDAYIARKFDLLHSGPAVAHYLNQAHK